MSVGFFSRLESPDAQSATAMLQHACGFLRASAMCLLRVNYTDCERGASHEYREARKRPPVRYIGCSNESMQREQTKKHRRHLPYVHHLSFVTKFGNSRGSNEDRMCALLTDHDTFNGDI